VPDTTETGIDWPWWFLVVVAVFVLILGACGFWAISHIAA
jgi:hypothetical protein